MHRFAALGLLVSLTVGLPQAGVAAVGPISSFSTLTTVPFGPDGVAYHPGSGNLFVVDSFISEVVELTTTGIFVSAFDHLLANGNLGFPEGIDVLPNGNLLVSDQTEDDLTEYMPDGTFVSRTPIPVGMSPTGVAFAAGTPDTVWVSDDDARLLEFTDTDPLAFVFEIDPTAFGVSEPEGIGVDPGTGNLLVVDDIDGTLTELTTAGTVVDTADLLAQTGFAVPEGVGVDGLGFVFTDTGPGGGPTVPWSCATCRRTYIAFDNDRQIVLFLPEPGRGASVLASLALLALLRSRRGRQG